MKNGLKWICAALLLYAGFMSLYLPMEPGGSMVQTADFSPGLNTFDLYGYATHFDEATDLQVFVRNDSGQVFCAEILSREAQHLQASVFLPDTLMSQRFSFYANNALDGTISAPGAVTSKGFIMGSGAQTCTVKIASENAVVNGIPYQPIIIESMRNLMWHVPMWFTMFVLMFISFRYSIGQLMSKDMHRSQVTDLLASSSAATGMVFCILGLITGSVWARFTWGAWWTSDPQLNGALVVALMYGAYFVLRGSVQEEEKRARLSAIFNIFACILMVMLLMVMPRFAEGLHPGKSGNPAFSQYDLDSTLRMVFYPACAGFILLGIWIYDLQFRINLLRNKMLFE